MRLDVALTAGMVRDPGQTVCIVVDILRASSACVAMFDSGVTQVAVAANTETARGLREEFFPDALLCGEVGGLAPEGFDFGNSPVEFSESDLRGRRTILSTSNGTRALHAVAASPAVFVGCLMNRDAVVAAALAAAARNAVGVTVVCAGNDLGTSFSLDDTFAAGSFITALTARLSADSSAPSPSPTDSAVMARRLYDSYRGDGMAAFQEAAHGRGLQRLGFAADLARCADVDRSRAVPVLVRDERGVLVLRNAADQGR
jgi:2-phosphosulfolactate phosphatase